ncbi:Uma2 family endonuclease [Tumidithrix elongata]
MVSLRYDHWHRLPTAEELPDSDETPVDNELQNDIPNFILSMLRLAWANRQDWFFGVDMGIYYHPNEVAIVPDGFLALGVERRKSERGRLSYVLWEEQDVIPLLALEVVSQKYNGEYEGKLETYQSLGILYYVIYNPLTTGRKRSYKGRQPLEVYKLKSGKYELLSPSIQGKETSIVWMPEIGFGVGCEMGTHGDWNREWLYLYDEVGNRYLTPEEMAEHEQQRANRLAEMAEHERQRANRLAEYLRSIDIDPDRI